MEYFYSDDQWLLKNNIAGSESLIHLFHKFYSNKLKIGDVKNKKN